MFEQYKLNKYADTIIGFAYNLFEPKFFSVYGIEFYLVIDKDPGYGFIKFKKIRTSSKGTRDKMITNLDAKTMEYWIKLNSKKQNDSKSK